MPRHPAAWIVLGCLAGLLCVALVFEVADIQYCQRTKLSTRILGHAQEQGQRIQQQQQGRLPQAQQERQQQELRQRRSEQSNKQGSFKFVFATFVASNSSRYIKWASLQHLAARKFAPDAPHIIYAASSVDKGITTALQSLGANVELVEPFQEHHQHGPTWVNQLTKIKLWSRTNYDMVCHLDSDVIFFSNITRFLVDECRPKLFDPSNPVDICGYENESCEPGPMNMNNRNHWGLPYMEASIFCLRPNMTLYNALLKAGVEPLQQHNFIVMRGKNVFTEQDFLNMYFKGRIHYFSCSKTLGRGNGTIVHTKGVEEVWENRMGSLPVEVFVAR